MNVSAGNSRGPVAPGGVIRVVNHKECNKMIIARFIKILLGIEAAEFKMCYDQTAQLTNLPFAQANKIN